MVRAYPDVFSGGCFLMGGSFYRNRKREDGTWEPTVQPSEPTAWNGPLDRLRKDLKLVIIKAERDATWTAAEGRADYESLLLDGFERVSFIEVPRLGHTHPNASWLEKGIVALESPPKKPPATAPTSARGALPSQQAQARRILATGQRLLESKPPSPKSARPFFQRVLDEYPATPAAAQARELLIKHGAPATQPRKD
jgi:hypothetical protein